MKDPVCGMEVTEPPRISIVLNNQTYGFCNPGCLSKFKANPDKYLSGSAEKQTMDQSAEEPKVKTFLPLIVVFSIILAFSFGAELYFRSWDNMRFMQNFMAAFFIVFSAMKLLNWKGFAEAYQTYDILAKRNKAYSYAYPLIELYLGLAYLFRWNLTSTNFITVVVMSVSAIGVAQALRKNQKFQCACLGVVFKIPMTKVTLMEDILMGVMALSMLVAGHA